MSHSEGTHARSTRLFRCCSSTALHRCLADDGSDTRRCLAFVYPARRLTNKSLPNPTLNIIVVASVALQILTITVPGLRTMLGLVPLDGQVLGLVAAALVTTVAGAEIWSRRAVRRKDPS